MRHTRTWLYFFLPFLYLAIVLGFVAFQFSKKTDSFSQSLGDLTLTGKNSTAGQPAELTLRGRGLVFAFDANHFLTVDGRDGTSARLRPVSWGWKDGNVVVTFQQGLELMFEKADVGGRALLIHPVPNASLDKVATLHIPFSPEGGIRLNRGVRATTLELVRDKSRLLASVDGAKDRIEVDNTFVLSTGKSGFRPARLDPIPAALSTDLAWVTLDATVDPAAAEVELNKYWDKAYTVWPTVTSFSTNLANAWGREALLRSDYPAVASKFQGLVSRTGAGWGFDAVPFLGNVVELTASQRRSVEAASSRSQPDWATQGRLWLDARLYGPSGSADRVKGLLLSGKLPDTAPELIGQLQNVLTIEARQPSDAVAARVEDLQQALLSKVIRREGQLFVTTADGLLDLKSTLYLGRLWLDYAKILSNEPFGIAGAKLVTSALSFLDAGKLPEILVTQDGQIVHQEGSLLPEQLYALLRPAPARELELPGWGSGAFVLSPMPLVSQQISAKKAVFVFRFPVGSAEHLVISGVPTFDHVTLHGIRWRTDPQFQAYTDGWAYSSSTKTLYVKVKHREELEELTIHFQPEQ